MLTTDSQGNVYVAEHTGHRIRKITPNGVVSTIAGNGATGFTNGVGTAITLNGPYGVAVDHQGNVYVADRYNGRIRIIAAADGSISTFVGNGGTALVDGTGTLASFYNPANLSFDNAGNLYVADRWNHAIRRVTKAGVVTTLGGNGVASPADGTGTMSRFNYPAGIAVDSLGNLYIGDDGNQRVRKMQ
jgi:sugar lactone lactonase YvrE